MRRLVSLLPWLVCCASLLTAGETSHSAPAGATDRSSATPPIDGARAYDYLQQICALGPRMSGSEGMLAQQALIARHLDGLGGRVRWQRFRARHPVSGGPIPMANMICQWQPESSQRILLCSHYDTRPLPDRDPNPVRRRSGTFVGANDGASGVAVLMELAHHMAQLKCPYGIDFALFDGEEMVYEERHPYFLGSEWFARDYVAHPPTYRYRWAVLLDMVGDADLQIFQERHSMAWEETRPLVVEIWATAERLGVREFTARRKHTVRDDHLKLRNIGRIPACNIIDFDYAYWHTEADTPSKCSAASLAKVGWVLYEWLQTVK